MSREPISHREGTYIITTKPIRNDILNKVHTKLTRIIKVALKYESVLGKTSYGMLQREATTLN